MHITSTVQLEWWLCQRAVLLFVQDEHVNRNDDSAGADDDDNADVHVDTQQRNWKETDTLAYCASAKNISGGEKIYKEDREHEMEMPVNYSILRDIFIT